MAAFGILAAALIPLAVAGVVGAYVLGRHDERLIAGSLDAQEPDA